MFGRRRHAATEVPAVPVPQLADAQILEVVHTEITELLGENGEWTVSRRSREDNDPLFHAVLAQSVSLGITAALVEARRRLEAGEPGPSETQQPLPSIAPVVGSATEALIDVAPIAHKVRAEPVAFGWEPAPLTVWADLRKPVTGEIPAIAERPAA